MKVAEFMDGLGVSASKKYSDFIEKEAKNKNFQFVNLCAFTDPSSNIVHLLLTYDEKAPATKQTAKTE